MGGPRVGAESFPSAPACFSLCLRPLAFRCPARFDSIKRLNEWNVIWALIRLLLGDQQARRLTTSALSHITEASRCWAKNLSSLASGGLSCPVTEEDMRWCFKVTSHTQPQRLLGLTWRPHQAWSVMMRLSVDSLSVFCFLPAVKLRWGRCKG